MGEIAAVVDTAVAAAEVEADTVAVSDTVDYFEVVVLAFVVVQKMQELAGVLIAVYLEAQKA